MKAMDPRNNFVRQISAIMLVFVFLFSAGTASASNSDNRAAGATELSALLTSEELQTAGDLSVASNTLFSFSIPKNDFVRFSVFNTNGSEISVLINENKKAGEFSADLNKAKLTKGTYYYRLVVGNYKEVRRLNIIK